MNPDSPPNLDVPARCPFSLVFLAVLMSLVPQVTAVSNDPLPASTFELSDVRLQTGPFAEAVTVNRAYLLALDPDRLFAPFLREAGLEPKKSSYGNWESGGLDGHTGGHYLSALALMVAAGGDSGEGELRSRLDYILDELERCQQAGGNGYIGGVPRGQELWQEIASGQNQRPRLRVE
jgi:uncharacterized protein